MLLIWDIHINSRYQNRIIAEIKHFIDENKDEKNIIFLWDYVYHFSYDRTALLALFNFFIDLFKQGKNVYILAWNHDRLWQHFVYQEAQTAFRSIIDSGLSKDVNGNIQFITKPELIKIEWKQIFFLPFFLAWEQDFKEGIWDWDIFNQISFQIQVLRQSKNKHEQQSALINQILLEQINKLQDQDILVLHHHYINATKFPWQKARFNFKDIALSQHFLDLQNIKIISGHLHQSFIHKNYCCLGSVRSSSPLEINQVKVVAQYDVNKEELNFYTININPYIFIDQKQDDKTFVDEDTIKEIREQVKKNSQDTLKDNENRATRRINLDSSFDIRYASITIKSETLDYEQIDKYIDKWLRMQFKDVKLKKQTASMPDLLKDFDIASKNLTDWIADWKSLLKVYLKQKYAEDYIKYEEFLQNWNQLGYSQVGWALTSTHLKL